MSDGGAPVERFLQFGPVVVAFDERVLQPRPWTLAQSRWAAELAAGAPPGPILELCAGAGHIGLAAAVLSGRSLVQVDIDEVACWFARANAERAGRDVEIRNAPMQLALEAGERFPLVVADPPYVPAAAVDRFPDDPPLAIDGGPSGLDLVQRCLEIGARHLAPGGHLLLQVGGPPQVAAVEGLAATCAPTLRMFGSRVSGPTRAVIHLADRGPVARHPEGSRG